LRIGLFYSGGESFSYFLVGERLAGKFSLFEDSACKKKKSNAYAVGRELVVAVVETKYHSPDNNQVP